MSEWTRTDRNYSQRVNHLLGITSGGLNESVLLNRTTVFSDAMIDTMAGGKGSDWFLLSRTGAVKDKAADLARTETASDTDRD